MTDHVLTSTAIVTLNNNENKHKVHNVAGIGIQLYSIQLISNQG